MGAYPMKTSPGRLGSWEVPITIEGEKGFPRRCRAALPLVAALILVGFMAALQGCGSFRKLENSAVALGTSPEQPGPTLTEQQALDDFRYLFDRFKDYHPYLALKKRTEGYDWLAHKADFESLVKSAKSNEDFAKAIARVVFSVNNGHTAIISGGSFKGYMQDSKWKDVAAATTPEQADYWYAVANKVAPSANYTPFIASYVRGEYVVTDVAPDPKIAPKVSVGYKVTKVNGIPVDEYVASHRGNRYLPYDPERKKLYETPRLFFPPPFAWSSAEFIDLDGNTVTTDMDWASAGWGAFFTNLPPFYAVEPNSMKPLNDLLTCTIDWNGMEVGYVYVPGMKADPAVDTARLTEFFTSVRELPAIIIDIRSNSGGTDMYWRTNIMGLLGTYSRSTGKIGYAMRERLAEALGAGSRTDKASFSNLVRASRDNVPPEIWTDDFREPETFYAFKTGGSVGYHGNVYVLTSRTVFSSAETFAASCRVTGFATLVGTYTGGDGIGITPGIIVLPNSGMAIRFPSVMGLNPDWAANEEYHTKPDVLVEESREDHLKWLESVHKEGFPVKPEPGFDTVLRECLNLATSK